MYVFWILIGIISDSGIRLAGGQISQLSNSPYGGGTYIDNLWAAKRPLQSNPTPSPRRSRVQQNVVNPRTFGLFGHTNTPFRGELMSTRAVTPTSTAHRSRWSDIRNGESQNLPFRVSNAEKNMYKTEISPPTTVAYGKLLKGVSRNNMDKVTALYAFDRHSQRHTSQIPTQTYTKEVRHVSRSRFKVLPDGSIVDYGISSSERNSVAPITREIRPITREIRPITRELRPKPTTTLPTRRPVIARRMKSSPRMINTSTFSVQPTASTRPQLIRPKETVSQSKTAVTSIDKLKPSSVWLNPSGPGLSGIAVRLSDLRQQTSMRPRVLLGPLDDGVRKPLSGLIDDPMWQREGKRDSRTRAFTQTRVRTKSMTTTTPTTTTTTTTTTPVPTTTTIRTTTTTQKPKRSIWNGPDAVNITYGDDNHVCPPSRARWQDYTVYLETKPRLCMIQITWNARYKREPRYHNSWWGVDVEWVYKPVYDPKVEFIDMHGPP